MTHFAKAIKVTDNIYWVGARDWGIRDFHGYATDMGSTYNAFLIIDEKITLIDTVKAPFYNEMMERIASIVDPEKIDYIVSNHAEMDHSGSLPATIAAVKPEKVFASIMGEKALVDHFGPLPITPVKNGEEISLGKETLKFIETRMLHWPDSMFTYLVEQKVLFTQDGFGMHLCGDELYSDLCDSSIIRMQAEKYYANILLPYAPQTLKLLEAVAAMELKVDLMVPDHGPIHRGEWIGRMLNWYKEFAEQKPTDVVSIVYASMWESTTLMARAIGEGCAEAGVRVRLMPLAGTHRSDVMTQVMNSGALIVGSPTINNQLYPTMADMLCYMKGLRPKNLVGGVFGSFGWSGEATKLMLADMQAMGVEVIGEGIKVKYVPTKEDLSACVAYGKQVAEALKTKLN